jgi:hypothetical protein
MMGPMSRPGEVQTPRARLRLRITMLLLPALALTVLWARSGMVGEVWSGARRYQEWRVRSDWGRLSLTVISGSGVDALELDWETIPGGGTHGVWPGPAWRAHDFLLGRYRAGGVFLSSTDTFWAVEVYHPVLIGLLVLPVALYGGVTFLRRRRVRRRLDTGLCAGCGYDLRGTSGRCPECGGTFPVNSTTAVA